ncbi:hypothetical protein IWQ62_001599 [Dispira parvispora]|uniref:Uncharacterized protein n=1 Tax=Dispira parvispora TaxID=1520584 RepID=A0A9W8AYM0_9FUNG|nr:hypothetical protein IWQ62_001599 [Dispira parvispora]
MTKSSAPAVFTLSDATRRRIVHHSCINKMVNVLETRLAYAKFKVDHGWQDKPFGQVTELYQQKMVDSPVSPDNSKRTLADKDTCSMSPRKRLRRDLEKTIPGISLLTPLSLDLARESTGKKLVASIPQVVECNGTLDPIAPPIQRLTKRHFSYPPTKLPSPSHQQESSTAGPSPLRRSISTQGHHHPSSSVGSLDKPVSRTLVRAAEAMLLIKQGDSPTRTATITKSLATPMSSSTSTTTVLNKGYTTPYSPSIRSTLSQGACPLSWVPSQSASNSAHPSPSTSPPCTPVKDNTFSSQALAVEPSNHPPASINELVTPDRRPSGKGTVAMSVFSALSPVRACALNGLS